MTERHRSDSELIQAAIDGDVEAFGALVSRYQRAALRVATIALGGASDADDVAQEAFVKAHKALPRFRAEAPFKPWLFRIVTNTAKNRRRSNQRHQALALRTAASTLDQADPSTDTSADRAIHLADRVRLVNAINRLRPDDRLILTYRWYEDLSEAEIAEALGCRRGTVKSRLSRAMSRLRAEFDPDAHADADEGTRS